MSPQQDGIPVPNPAKRLFSLTRLSHSPALTLLPVPVKTLLFDFLHKKLEQTTAKNPSQVAGAAPGQLPL